MSEDAILDDEKIADRRASVKYAALTAALFFPLFLTFISIRDLYPFAASTMMVGLRDIERERRYYVLSGETIGGESIDLPPIKLTNALSGRNWSLVTTAVENRSFKIRKPHPENINLAFAYGGVDRLPRATRLEELLRAWGGIYNSRLPASSKQRLKSVKLDAFAWEGGVDGDYDRFVESWSAAL